MQIEVVLQAVVLPSLKIASETIPDVAKIINPELVLIYGEEGAVFDSLNLVNFIFILEEKIMSEFGVDFKFSTEDILNTEARPFLNAMNLANFLTIKISELR